MRPLPPTEQQRRKKAEPRSISSGKNKERLTKDSQMPKFIDLVAANKIRRFTRYSVENWQLKPEEFYAEAYSLWLVDPNFLKNNYPVVYDFFQNGEYRR